MKQSAVMHPTQKYAWVCSFQETPSEPITSNCDQFIFDLGEERDQLREELSAAQSRIDELMLEYCPDEMTQDQIDNWAKHQQAVPENELPEFLRKP